MKILLVHNYYRSTIPSGENQVFKAEHNLLERHGHQVSVFTRNNDEIVNQGALGKIHGAAATPFNPWTAAAVRREVECRQPDVVHVHNTFPLISPSIFKSIGRSTARVLTLHNYRLFCPSAILMRNGRICTACLDSGSVWRSIVFGCYRGRRAATVPLALSVALHRAIGTWSRHVDAFVALSEFQKRLMLQAGLPTQRVYVKPNFYAGNPVPVSWHDRGEYAVYAGRLSVEKGVEDLICAWLRWGSSAPELRILGEGPLRRELERISGCAAGNHIRFMDQMPLIEADKQIAHAKLLILPSLWHEAFGMSVITAFAYGTPVAVSAIEPLRSLVSDGENGMHFIPGKVDSILRKIRSAWETPGQLERLGRGASYAFEARYTEDSNYDMLMKIYQTAIANTKSN
jgi:glycosyltransferase involved in cell wall biosynthesis